MSLPRLRAERRHAVPALCDIGPQPYIRVYERPAFAGLIDECHPSKMMLYSGVYHEMRHGIAARGRERDRWIKPYQLNSIRSSN